MRRYFGGIGKAPFHKLYAFIWYNYIIQNKYKYARKICAKTGRKRGKKGNKTKFIENFTQILRNWQF